MGHYISKSLNFISNILQTLSCPTHLKLYNKMAKILKEIWKPEDRVMGFHYD